MHGGVSLMKIHMGLCVLCLNPSGPLVCTTCTAKIRSCIHTQHEVFRTVPGTHVPLFSFASYQGSIKEFIHLAKSHRIEHSALVDPWLWLAAERLSQQIRASISQALAQTLVVPIPKRRFGLDSRRRLARDLAYLIASQAKCPCDPSLIKFSGLMHRYFGRAQKERNRWQRTMFAPEYQLCDYVKKYASTNTEVLLVDDVCTTGESLRTAIKCLEEGGLRVSGAALLADTPAYV
jgi:predicted amidophosphoribosyltransferase